MSFAACVILCRIQRSARDSWPVRAEVAAGVKSGGSLPRTYLVAW